MVTATTLLTKLPPFRDEWVVIKENQKVDEIIKQILAAHQKYAAYYDTIALYFDADTTEKICENLYDFCKAEIIYKEESEDDQTTALPAGILTRGEGDCKHYAGFCAGVLDAIKRLTGKKINWCYRFASYNLLTKTPHHVFVVVKDKDGEIWIDPVPGANNLEPYWQVDKKINTRSMPLSDNIGSVLTSEYNYDNTGLYGIGGPEASTIKLPAYVDLLASHFTLVSSESEVSDNNKIVAMAKARFDSTAPKLGDDSNLRSFLAWIKLSVLSKFGVLVRPLWEGGFYDNQSKWADYFAPWFQLYYPNEWQIYLDAWHDYSAYSFNVIYNKWKTIIDKGMALVDKVLKSFTGISFVSPTLPPATNIPPPVTTDTNNSILYAVIASVGTYFFTKKMTTAGVVGIGTYFLMDRLKPATTPTTPGTTTTTTNHDASTILDDLVDKYSDIDYGSLFK